MSLEKSVCDRAGDPNPEVEARGGSGENIGPILLKTPVYFEVILVPVEKRIISKRAWVGMKKDFTRMGWQVREFLPRSQQVSQRVYTVVGIRVVTVTDQDDRGLVFTKEGNSKEIWYTHCTKPTRLYLSSRL